MTPFRRHRHTHRLLIAAAFAVIAQSAFANPWSVFGPKQYVRTTGAPQTVRETFAAHNTALPYTLRLENGGGTLTGTSGAMARVTSAAITLNGADILTPKDFNASTPAIIEKSITVNASNELTIELRGDPGAGVTLSILADDSELPTITASVSPQPNGAGWNAALPVTVTFTCADATSGIATCSAPVTIEGDGTGLEIPGTAVDNAGNTNTTSIILNIDTQAPVLQAVSPVGTEGTNAPSVTIAGLVADNGRIDRLAINGVNAGLDAGGHFSKELALNDGANSVAIDAYDRAGNHSATSFSIERFAIPVVKITSPADLAVVTTAAINVTGTVSDPAATVTLNGLAATVAGNTFTVTGVPLAQGRTSLTAIATTASGHSGTANVDVYRDGVPPRVAVRYPAAGSVLYTQKTDVLGMVDDVVVGTINSGQARVTVNGVVAEVANRAFVAHDVPLTSGANTINVVAVDQGNNSGTTTINVTYDASAKAKIVTFSGNGQTGSIGTRLPQPIVVKLLNADGSPAANRTVSFEVIENDGTLLGSNNVPRTAIVATTDASGLASATWTLGGRAGAGNNRVVARSEGFSGAVEFEATSRTGTPALIVVDSGNNQFGAVGSPLARPLVAVVVDSGSNRLAGVPVTFRVSQGNASFDGAAQKSVITDSDGRAWVTPTLNADGETTFGATIDNTETLVSFHANGKLAGAAEATRITGVVLDNTDLAVAGVTVRVEGTTLTTLTDDQGQFTIAPAPVGYVKLVIDGSTARRAGTWPMLEYVMYTIPGASNTLDMPIHILPIDVRRGLFVDETTGGTLTLPELPGFSLTIKPGSATFPGGSRTGTVSVTLVHTDKIPMAPGFGQQPRFIVTIQPPGVHFDPPAALTFPNVDGLAPGQITELYSFDHDLGQFVAIGTGSVSADGSVIKSDPGVGIIKGGWHCGGTPGAKGTAHKCPDCKKCVDDCCVPDPIQNNGPCGKENSGICKDGKCICPHPTNFHQVSQTAANGVIQLKFEWDSSTGFLGDLAGCQTGELLNNANGAMDDPSPPFASHGSHPPAEYVFPPGGSVEGTAQDTFKIPGGGFKKPYKPYSSRVVQWYVYKCPCYNNGNDVQAGGPFNIDRRIYQDPSGKWWYEVSRNGVSSKTPLP